MAQRLSRIERQLDSLECVVSWEKSLVMYMQQHGHSRPQRPRSFLSAPRIGTSGQFQNRKSANLGLPIKSDKSDWLRI